MKLLPVVILLSFLLSACQDDPRIRRVLDEADRKIVTMPDSAAVMLESLDVSAAPASQRARHALLLTKARHKAHIIETDDSLIKTASDYYRGSGDSLEVQSLFYNGVILKYQKDYPEALIYLMETADRAAATGDDFYRGMACREQASVYTELDNYDRAAQLGNEAAEAFTRAGYPLHAAWERVYIPQSLAYSGKVDEAYDTIKALAADSIIQSDRTLRTEFLWGASNVCFERNDYAQSEKYFDMLVNEGVTPSSKMYSQMAILQREKGDIVKAKEYYDLASGCQRTLADSLAALHALSRIYEADGDYRNAYNLTIYTNGNSNQLINKLITHPYTALINDFYRSETHRKSVLLDEATLRIMIWISVSFALLITIISIIYVYNHRLRQKDLEREILIRDLSRLEAQVTEAFTIKSVDSSIPEVNKLPFTLLESICECKNAMYLEGKGVEAFGKKVSELIRQLADKENLEMLEKYIDESLDNLMSRFRRQTVGLSKRQYEISIFVFLGFSDSSIASIFNDRPVSNPRQERYRIRKKLKERPCQDTELFLKYF